MLVKSTGVAHLRRTLGNYGIEVIRWGAENPTCHGDSVLARYEYAIISAAQARPSGEAAVIFEPAAAYRAGTIRNSQAQE